MIPWDAIISMLSRIIIWIFDSKVSNDKAKKEFIKFVEYMQTEENMSIKLSSESNDLISELRREKEAMKLKESKEM